MNEEWWEQPTCFVCDYWWALLLGVVLLLAGYFTRAYWWPSPPPPTPTPSPSATPPLPTSEAEPTLALGTGDVQVTLHWSTLNDIDLHVVDPAGERIFYNHPTSASSGFLDVDANRGCDGNITSRPVENIYWPTGAAPRGNFSVEVEYYERCLLSILSASPEDNYTVRVLVDDQVKEFSGTLTTPSEHKVIYEFVR